MDIKVTRSFEAKVLKNIWTLVFCLGVILFFNVMMFANLPGGNTSAIIDIQDGIHFLFSFLTLMLFSKAFMGVILKKKSVWIQIVSIIIVFGGLVLGGVLNPFQQGIILGSWLTIAVTSGFFIVFWRWK